MGTKDADERLEALKEYAHNHGFNRLIGYTLEDVGDDWARASVSHTDEFVNPPTENAMHGGVAASSIDATMGYAVISSLFTDSSRTAGPTISLTINYVATADEPLEVEASIARMGKYVAFLEGTVRGQETDKIVATGQGVWLIFDNNA